MAKDLAVMSDAQIALAMGLNVEVAGQLQRVCLNKALREAFDEMFKNSSCLI